MESSIPGLRIETWGTLKSEKNRDAGHPPAGCEETIGYMIGCKVEVRAIPGLKGETWGTRRKNLMAGSDLG